MAEGGPIQVSCREEELVSSVSYDFDVVVVGGGAGGVAAAIGAAGTGARVCLVEKHGYLGGAAVASSVLTYCGFFDRSGEQVIAGVGQQFLDRLQQLDLFQTHTTRESGNTVVLLDLETTKRVLDAMVTDAGVTVFFHGDVFSASHHDGRVASLEFNHRGGRVTVGASAFVDASGDGALLNAAGVGVHVSPVGSRQASTLVMRVGGVAEDGELGQEAVRTAVRDYMAASGVSLGREHGAMVRLPLSREVMVLIADQHRDMLDVADSSRAELDARRDAAHYLEALRSSVPGWSSSFLAATGPEMGVRETRRLVGRRPVTGDDVSQGRRRIDVIARGGWPMEDHSVAGRTRYARIRDDHWYDLPYGSIVSQTHSNIWVAGRLTSSDDRAYSSTRVMGTAFGTGHAAGVAAALSAQGDDPSVETVQHHLREQSALL